MEPGIIYSHLPQNVVPLYLATPEAPQPFKFLGTGSLVKRRGKTCIITAAHVSDGLATVIDDEKIVWETLLVPYEKVPTPAEEVPLLRLTHSTETVVPENKIRDDDLIDLAVFELPGDAESKFGKLGFVFADLDTPCRPIPPGTKLFFLGYPGQEQRVKSWAGAGLFEAQPIGNRSYQATAAEFARLKVPLGDHIVAPYLNEATRPPDFVVPEKLILPHGMSGGTIWEILPDEKYAFAGIITRWAEAARYFIGTNCAISVDMVEREMARQGLSAETLADCRAVQSSSKGRA